MGIYTKRRSLWSLKTLLIILLIAFTTFVIVFNFFFSEKKIINLNSINLNSQLDENLISNNKKDSNIYLKKEDIDLDKFFTKSEFDQSIKEFVENNPDFILNVLRQYQLNQNILEQEKINQENISSIQNLNSQVHPMYLGDPSANKVIYEFVDYNCGYCHKYHQELLDVMKKDNSIKLVIIQMPILGNSSQELSEIALASSLQGQFEVVHNYLYSSDRKSNIDDILADLFLRGVDLKRLKYDLDSQEVSNFLSTHKVYVDEFKFTGSPATIIGNQIIPGYIDSNKITEILEKEFS